MGYKVKDFNYVLDETGGIWGYIDTVVLASNDGKIAWVDVKHSSGDFNYSNVNSEIPDEARVVETGLSLDRDMFEGFEHKDTSDDTVTEVFEITDDGVHKLYETATTNIPVQQLIGAVLSSESAEEVNKIYLKVKEETSQV